MRHGFLKLVISFTAVLFLASCSFGQDFSAQIEKDVQTEFSEYFVKADFQTPAIFKNCELSENGSIDVTSSEIGIKIALQGNIKSDKTKLDYQDVEVQVFKDFSLTESIDFSKYSIEEYASHWTAESGVEFTKYVLGGKDYYIAEDDANNIFNIICMNGGNISLVTGSLADTDKINKRTERKICEDFSVTE